MPKAEKALVLGADFYASMSLTHIQDESGQTLTGREEREALTDIGQSGVRRFVRQAGMTCHPADRRINDQTGRAVRTDNNP